MFISIEPVAKPRMTRSDRWNQRSPVNRYRAFCDELRLKNKHRELPEVLILTFYLPMPPSWTKLKKSVMLGKPHRQKPDIDNLCKAVMDALAEDDSYVYILQASKWWSDTPGIEFGIIKER
jgi:Holliday junction resolvase RusA-like endonuclease